MRVVFSTWWTQSMFNTVMLTMLNFMSAFVTFKIFAPLAKSGALRIIPVFIHRAVTLLPAMAAIVALDIIWPLIGSGPFYTRVATFVRNKCARNWWANLLFINSFLPALEQASDSWSQKNVSVLVTEQNQTKIF